MTSRPRCRPPARLRFRSWGKLQLSQTMGVSSDFALLLGGGVESAYLLSHLLSLGRRVVPVRISLALRWEPAERRAIARLCAALEGPRLEPLVEVRSRMSELLHAHWAVASDWSPPAGQTAALELPLRNWTLLLLAALRLRERPPAAFIIGTTRDNRFPDGTPQFFHRCAEVLTYSVNYAVRVETPLLALSKSDVLRRCPREVAALSWSCVSAVGEVHCGACVKCVSRRRAFKQAGLEDPTDYAVRG